MKTKSPAVKGTTIDPVLPGNWVRLSLGEIGSWKGGGTPSRTNVRFWNNGKIPWASPKDMKSFRLASTQEHITDAALRGSATNIVEKGSVLLVTRSGILSHTLPVALTEQDMALNQDLKAIRPAKQIDANYLVLALRAFNREVLSKCAKGGTTVPSMEMTDLLRFRIPIAPIDEQRRIVAEIEKQFTRLEAGVAALRRVQANLKRYRVAVLKAACEGRLVPTEAELAHAEGRPFESGQQLLARILTERRLNWHGPGKYKEPVAATANVLPELPEGWTWATPDQLAASDDGAICAGPFGTIFKAHDFRTKGVPIIFLRHVAPGRYLTHKPGFMDEAKWEELFRSYSVFGGELLITKLGEPPGVCAIYPKDIGPAMVTPDVIKMTPKIEAALPHFLMHYFNSQTARDFATGVAFGTTRLRLTIPIFREMPIPLPPLAEQTRIVAEVERRLTVVEELEAVVNHKLESAKHLSQSILNHAFKGQLPTNDPADKRVIIAGDSAQPEFDMKPKKRSKNSNTATGAETFEERLPLSEALRSLPHKSTLEGLCVAAGYSPAVVSDVDAFFQEVKASLGTFMTLDRTTDEGDVIVRRATS